MEPKNKDGRKMEKVMTSNFKAIHEIMGDCNNLQSFYEKFAELANSRDDAVKKLLKDAGGYRKIWFFADRKFNQDCNTVAIIEKWFNRNLDTPALAMADPSGYRYKVAERYEGLYGFKYPSDFLYAYELYMEIAAGAEE